jgi:hypothetical protein
MAMNPAGTGILWCAACALIGAASSGQAANAALYQAAKNRG